MNSARGVLPLVLAVIGVVALGGSFVTGISAALDGSGSGALPYEIVFIVALVLVLAALIMAIINLIRGRSRVYSLLAIVVSVLPLSGILLLRFLAG